MIRESTPEEIEAARERSREAECLGDGVHTTDMRFWHDWRLWDRGPRYVPTTSDFSSLAGHYEQWYCTRCRKIEERTVMLDGS